MIARLQRPRLALALGLVLAFAAVGRGAWAEPAGQGADLILVNGSVSTPSGWSQAVAIRGGVILAVGESPAIKALASPGAKVVDLAGATVLPGLDDSHVHPLFAGLEQFACGFAPGASARAIVTALKICVAEKQPGDWILGGNWVAASFAPGEQTRATLDAVAPANPVLLNDEAHHSIWVNSRALALAGVTPGTPNPEGGIIERDAAGEPTGLLRENATKLVERIVPRPSMDARRKALILASHQMLSYGVTAFTVASVRLDDIGPLSALSAEGLIKQRMRGCIVWTPDPEDGNTMGDTLIAQRARYEQPRFRLDCVKMFLDGVPTESHTAAMIAPYVDIDPEHGDPRSHNGLPMMTQVVLDAAVTRFDAEGLSVKFHAAGDGAVRAALDAVAAARRANGYGGQVHVVAHATFVDPAEIPRARALNAAWEFSPYIWYPTPIASVDILRAVGPERMERWMPIREAVETGALVVAGSDWSVVPSVNPWPPIETLVTRQKPGGSAETIGVGERVRIDQALRIFTVNGARLTGSSDKVGTIAPGMQADLIVLDRNPYRAPITQVHDTKVLKTFIAGELVYDAASPPPLTAR